MRYLIQYVNLRLLPDIALDHTEGPHILVTQTHNQ